jgi:integrase
MRINQPTDTTISSSDSLEQTTYMPLFTKKVVKTRSRLVNTSTNEWDVGETQALLINFNLININNVELIDQIKYVIAWFLERKSPSHSVGIYKAIKNILNVCDNLEDETGLGLAEAFSEEVINYFAYNRQTEDENILHLCRLFYGRGVKLKLPLFDANILNALERISLKGRVKGLDILVHVPNKSPLTSNKLADLRHLLVMYKAIFKVGDASYWRLAATWIFITLGIRPVQLRMLMTSDLAININSETGHKSYLLNVPSAKKRLENPRSRFKSRPIPSMLGEMLESLMNFNIAWLRSSKIPFEQHEVPLFFSLPTSTSDLRKDGARLSMFKWSFSSDSITDSTKVLIDRLNKLQVANNEPAFDELITPRRLRKTFATHAAACGTPAMMLMELLDHEDLQHVMIYYKLGANFAIKVDKVYREQFGTMFDYFTGKISLQTFSEANKAQQVFGPDSLRKLVGIGFCGKDGRCMLVPPYSCYTCVKFEACNNKQIHVEVLESMLRDVDELFGKNAAPGKYEMDHINGCRSLIARLENGE